VTILSGFGKNSTSPRDPATSGERILLDDAIGKNPKRRIRKTGGVTQELAGVLRSRQGGTWGHSKLKGHSGTAETESGQSIKKTIPTGPKSIGRPCRPARGPRKTTGQVGRRRTETSLDGRFDYQGPRVSPRGMSEKGAGDRGIAPEHEDLARVQCE